MKINLAQNLDFKVNLVEGNVSLDYKQIEALLKTSTLPVVQLGTSDILCLDLDLYARTKIDEIRYYYETTESSGTVASGIRFQYINEDYETLMDSPTDLGNGYFYTTVSGSSAPRFIRLLHTLSGTSSSGTVHGYQVLSDESIIDFGSDGSLDKIDTLAGRGESVIYPVPIYNSGDSVATAYVRLEPTGKNVDTITYLSNSENGPWIGVRNSEFIFMDKDNWSKGTLPPELVVYDDKLTLSYNTRDVFVNDSLSFNHTFGTYTTVLFKSTVDSYNYTKLVIDDLNSSNGSKIKVDKTDSSETIKIRNSESIMKYDVYRTLYTRAANQLYYIGYKEFTVDGEIEITNQDNITHIVNNYGNLTNYLWDINQDTGFSAVGFSTSYTSYLIAFSYGATTAPIKTLMSSYSSYKHTLKFNKIKLDSSNGIWLDLDISYVNSGSLLDKKGNYLVRFDSDLSGPTFKLFDKTKVLNGFDITPDGNWVWYSSTSTGLVSKLDLFGNEVISYYGKDVVKPTICAGTVDGGCWFINDKGSGINDLIRVTSEGLFHSGIYNFSQTGTIIQMEIDGEDGLWLLIGYNLVYIRTVDEEFGRVMFNVEIPFAYYFHSDLSGCWVITLHGQGFYVDKFLGQVVKTIMSVQKDYQRRPGFINKSPEEKSPWQDKLPLPQDLSWSSLPYTKVNNYEYYIHKNNYYQAEVTLQAAPPQDMYDNLTLDEDWLPGDEFNYTIDGRPAQHRWNTYDNRSIIKDERLLFKGHGIPNGSFSTRIDSHHKWYVNKYVTNEFEFQFDYDIPSTAISGTSTIVFSIRPNSINNDTDQYYRWTFSKSIQEMTLKTEAYGSRRDHSSGDRFYRSNTLTIPMTTYSGIDTTYSGTAATFAGAGVLKFSRTSGDYPKLYLYHYDGVSWQSVYCDAYYSWYGAYPIWFNDNRSLNVEIKVDSPNDVYIDKFQYNNNVSDCYWYLTPPLINSIQLQPLIKVESIYPSTSKNAYLKIDVPDSNDFKVDEVYNTNILTWWEVEVN